MPASARNVLLRLVGRCIVHFDLAMCRLNLPCLQAVQRVLTCVEGSSALLTTLRECCGGHIQRLPCFQAGGGCQRVSGVRQAATSGRHSCGCLERPDDCRVLPVGSAFVTPQQQQLSGSPGHAPVRWIMIHVSVGMDMSHAVSMVLVLGSECQFEDGRMLLTCDILG
jgi:hypothetical protein